MFPMLSGVFVVISRTNHHAALKADLALSATSNFPSNVMSVITSFTASFVKNFAI